jgi:thymidylate kinase
MIIIVEGPDRVGKDTQINKIKRYLEERNDLVHVMHYSSIKGTDIENRSKLYYDQMFEICNQANKINVNLILNRAHLGETVYSPIYRNYNADWIFDLEKSYIKQYDYRLIVFIADPEDLIKREDGLSFSNELTKKRDEIERFTKAYHQSNIKNKMLINITGKNIDDVWREVKKLI